jgi:hypothetical protein
VEETGGTKLSGPKSERSSGRQLRIVFNEEYTPRGLHQVFLD